MNVPPSLGPIYLLVQEKVQAYPEIMTKQVEDLMQTRDGFTRDALLKLFKEVSCVTMYLPLGHK